MNAIGDGETMYVWNDQGIALKMTMPKEDEVAKDAQTEATDVQTETTDVNQEVDYRCGGWTGDQDKFKLPANIEFVDVSSTVDSLKQKSEDMQKLIPSITIPKMQ